MTAGAELLERSDELGRVASALGEARAGRGTFVLAEMARGSPSPLVIASDPSWESGLRAHAARACDSEPGRQAGGLPRCMANLPQPIKTTALERMRGERPNRLRAAVA